MDNLPTVKLYFDGSYRYTADASVVAVDTLDENSAAKHSATHAIVLDASIFYPQGGGQPSDTGSIVAGEVVFNVKHVSFAIDTGVITHIGVFAGGAFAPGDAVSMRIDGEKRLLHCRLHTAGHFLRCMSQSAEPILTPHHAAGGYHFPAGPYIDYTVPAGLDTSPEALKVFKARIEDMISGSIHDTPVVIEEMNLSEAEGLLGPEAVSSKARAAPRVRVVRFSGHGDVGVSACGGTHLRNTSEIGRLSLRKVSIKSGVLRIAYAVS